LINNTFIFRGLACSIALLFAIGILLQQQNQQLRETNNKLLLQNDSVLSVNLKLQKDILVLKRGLDSAKPEKQQLTSRWRK
jgi:hypothetical protein